MSQSMTATGKSHEAATTMGLILIFFSLRDDDVRGMSPAKTTAIQFANAAFVSWIWSQWTNFRRHLTFRFQGRLHT